ncbi:hypothetical protein FMN50_20320 [Rhodobacterales bacterium]|nr:hypothetical protein FMN50_20320 [Rhodobacterales bacterium]
MKLRVVSPATYDDCLTLSPPTRYARKVMIRMRSEAETVAVYAGDDLLCVGYLFPCDSQEYELCFSVSPKARRYMLQILRITHLTVTGVANTNRIVSARVRPGHKPGERMVRLIGFTPDPDTPGKWVFSGSKQNGRNFWRREEGDSGICDGRCAQKPRSEPDRAGAPAPATE